MRWQDIYRNVKLSSGTEVEDSESSSKKKKLSGFCLRNWIPDSSVYLFPVVIMCLFGDYQKPLGNADFLDTWTRWDSAHYINISEDTYAGAIENGQHIFLVFYPLYPWLIRTLNLLYIIPSCRR
ncbi:MAG: hypothetical protein V8S42_08870 [Lachnospiraceae bacterium]